MQSGANPRGSDVIRSKITMPAHGVLMLLVCIVIATVAHSGVHESDALQEVIALGTGFGVIALAAYAACILGFPLLSAPTVYLILFWAFYFGLSFTAVFVPGVLDSFAPTAKEWLFWPNARLTMLLALLGAAGFVLGLGFTASRARPAAPAIEDWPHEPALFRVGWALLLAGSGLAVLALLGAGGIDAFSRGYMEFRETTLAVSQLLPAIQLAQLGCLLCVCGAGGRSWVAPTVMWAVFGFVLLLLGLRGEAMVPLVGLVVLLAYRGLRLKRTTVIAVILAALLGLSASRAVREVGFRNRSIVNWTEVTPLDTLVELGGTLRAANAYVDWIEEGDPLLYGAGYFAPFDRHFLVWVIPGREHVPIFEDPRVPGQQMALRVGAVGTAALGEAYYNFGTLGPLVFFAAIGLLFGWLDRTVAGTPYRAAVLGVLMFIFYWNFRGQWIYVPAQFAIGLFFIGGCWFLGNRRSRTLAHASDVLSSV